MIRAVVVDDEPLARLHLLRLLAEHDDVHVVGEADSAAAAAELLAQKTPDVVFLDIEMPQGSGLELVQALSPQPAVVFTTAHAQFAVAAFDLNAVDYLLKPLDSQRLGRALHRVRRALAGNRSSVAPRGGKIAVRSRGDIHFIDAHDIDWIAAEGNYSRIHAAGKSYLVRHLLNGLAEMLDARAFLRVHRSAIVNVERIRRVTTRGDGSYAVVLEAGDTLPIGVSYRKDVEEALGQKF
ncbi:MAG TPA: LytTR family DNA-binding domain-containing protein [Thermoanaerobaculia bacterium]